jgi:hypothetical protein
LLNTRDVPLALERLQRAASRSGSGEEVVLVLAARYLASATRERIAEANVALASGKYDVVFDRADAVDGVRFAALSQVAVELLTGPGRNPSEATALLDWMAANESAWRR